MRPLLIAAFCLSSAAGCSAGESTSPITDETLAPIRAERPAAMTPSSAWPARISPDTPSVADLAPGDRLEIERTMSGCFHHQSAQLTITSEGVEVVSDVGRHRLPPLSTDERHQLDWSIDVARWKAKQRCNCTSSVSLRMRWYNGGSPVQDEHVHHACCGGIPRAPQTTHRPMLSVAGLVSRAKKHDLCSPL